MHSQYSTTLGTGVLAAESVHGPIHLTKSALSIRGEGLVRYDSYFPDWSKGDLARRSTSLNPLFIITRPKESPARYEKLAGAIVGKSGFNVCVMSHDHCDRADPDRLLSRRGWRLNNRAQILKMLIETEGGRYSHASILITDVHARVVTQHLRGTNPGMHVVGELLINITNPTGSETRFSLGLKAESLLHKLVAPRLALGALRGPPRGPFHSSQFDASTEQIFGLSGNGVPSTSHTHQVVDIILAKVRLFSLKLSRRPAS